MRKPVDAEVLRAISFDGEPRGDSLTIGRPRGPEATRVLVDLLYGWRWGDVLRVMPAVDDAQGIGSNGSGFRYPYDLDPCEEPFEGVHVYDPLDEIVVPLTAFGEVIVRFVRALIAGAERLDHPVRSAPWWPELLRLADRLETGQDRAAQARLGIKAGIVKGEIQGYYDEAMFVDKLVTRGSGEIVSRTPHPLNAAITRIEYRLYQRDAEGYFKTPRVPCGGLPKRKTVIRGLVAAVREWQALAQEATDSAIRALTMPVAGGRYKGSTSSGLEIDGYIRSGHVKMFHVVW